MTTNSTVSSGLYKPGFLWLFPMRILCYSNNLAELMLQPLPPRSIFMHTACNSNSLHPTMICATLEADAVQKAMKKVILRK